MHLRNFSIEDFKEQNTFGYIPAHLDTNVLNCLCSDISSRIEISKLMVISVKKRDSMYFLTEFHIKWAMECIGYSFSLSMEHSTTISQAISIYQTWLKDKTKRPHLISTNESFYQREIIGQMSLIFADRPWELIHAELCSQVLRIYRLLIRKDVIFKENENFLMKLCIICFSPILSKNTEFAKKIGGEMSRAIFEIWLRCETKEEILWTEVCTDFSRWVIHTDVINSWRSVAVGLSQFIMSFLYGENALELMIVFQEEGTIICKSSIEHIILSWNYLVNVILDHSSMLLFDAITHKDIVRSVASIIDVFIEVSHKRSLSKSISTPFMVTEGSEKIQSLSLLCQKIHLEYSQGACVLPMPDIKSLMNLFGDWLLRQANIKGNNLYGKAEAIGCLCKIFYKAAGPAPKKYLKRFYKVIFKGFKFATEYNIQVAGSILKNSAKLISQDHFGIRVLLHKACIFKVFGPFITSKDMPQSVKAPCFEILSSIISIMKPYKNHGIVTTINDSLIIATNNETEPDNIISLCWSICSYISIIDEISLNDRLIKCLSNKILSMDNNDKKLYIDCINILSIIPFMIKDQNLISENIVKDIISKFILSIPRKSSKNLSDTLYISCLSMLLNWIIKFPKILQDCTLTLQVFEVLFNLKNFERMKEYISYIESFLLNDIGRCLPEFTYCYNNSITITPSFLTNDYSRCLKHYIYRGKCLISLCNTEDGALAILRNQTGRYVWKIQPVFGKLITTKKKNLVVTTISPRKDVVILDDSKKNQKLKRKIKNYENSLFEKICKKYETSKKNISSFTKPEKKEKKNHKNNESLSSESHSRSLLSQLGFFQQDLIGEISALNFPEGEYYINELDNINDKEIFIIPIFYLEKPETIESELLIKSSTYPEPFKNFINQMGICISLRHKSYDIFKSISSLLDIYETVLLTREYYYEIVSLIPAISNINKSLNLDDLLQYGQLVVLWNQRYFDPYSLKQPILLDNLKFKRKTIILLTPLRNNIIRVNIFGGDAIFGPLINNMLIPYYQIGVFLCKTIAKFNTNASSGLAIRQKRTDMLNSLKEIAIKSEYTKNGKISSVLSHNYNNS